MFKKPVLISFSVILAILGGGISMISSLINETSAMFLVSAALISAIIMGLMGIGIHHLLKWQIPILFANDQNKTEENSNKDANEPSTQDEEIFLEETEKGEGSSEQEDENKDNYAEESAQEEDILTPGTDPVGTPTKDASDISHLGADNANQKTGDKVIVDNFMLKNDPQLMTETVKHVLDSEENQ